MKILFIVPSYKPAYVYGGPIRSVSSLCEALVVAGHEVTVYTTNACGKKDLDIQTGIKILVEGVNVFYFKRWTKDHSNFSPSLLYKLKSNVTEFEVVHIQSWWNAVVMPATLICVLRKVKPIISPRGSITSYTFNYRNTFFKSWLHKLGGKSLLTKAAFHTTSFEEVNELKMWVNENPEVYMLTNILDLPAKIHEHPTDSGTFKLIFLSRIDPKKNLELLFRVLRKMDSIPFTLTILGDGNEGYVSRLKTESADIPGISWMGNVDGNEKYRLLAEADLLLLPSYSENYGNVIFESLSQGTPVIISGKVGARDYVELNQLGWIVEGDDLDWQHTLQKIWIDRATRDNIRTRAPVCIANDFRASEQVKGYEKMYDTRKNLSHTI